MIFMERLFDVTGMGCVSIDYLGKVSAWPDKGLKTPMDTFIIQGGGLVATALVTVAKLGGKARFSGFLGTSPTATSAREKPWRPDRRACSVPCISPLHSD